MITSTTFVFGNTNKRFTILDIYDDNNIKPPEPLNTILSQEEPKNKCFIIC
jgi:hypothetical protein